jgi:hypothetical protein
MKADKLTSLLVLVTLVVGMVPLAAGAQAPQGPVDVTLGLPAPAGLPAGGGAAVPFGGTQAILDDFNRADGPIGPDWTVRDGFCNVSNNAAVCGDMGRATFNSAPGDGNVAEADVAVNTTNLQYTGLLLDYGAGATNLFLKVQNQNGDLMFHHAGCYYGNNVNGFGLGFFALDSPFATAHFRVTRVGNDVTLEFTNVDGGAQPPQTYVCSGAPAPEGTGIGILGYAGYARLDNFGGPGDVQEPDIEVNPASLYAEQCPDTITTQTLQICNVGNAELIWSLSEALPKEGRAALPQRAAAPKSDDAGAFSPAAYPTHIAGGPDLLIIQDQYPWGLTSIQDILIANAIPFDQVDSSQIPTVDLSPYGLVVIPSNQPDAFYSTWNASITRFEDYVNAGGALWLSTCADSGTTPEPLVPGGVINATDLDNYNVIVDPAHPWAAGVPNPIYGDYASHDSFTNLYAGSVVVAQAQTSGLPTLVDYQIGWGRILITGQTLEYAWANGWDGGPILQNSLLDMFAWAPADQVPWLSQDPVAGDLNPGGCSDMTVTFDSTGLAPGDYFANLAIDSNDPDEPTVTVPVQLTVLECGANELHINRTKIFRHPSAPGVVKVVTQFEIFDQNGLPVPGATMAGEWTLPDGFMVPGVPFYGLTDALGHEKFRLQDVQVGTYMFCVTGITAPGFAPWPPGGYPGDPDPCLSIPILP